MSDTPPPIVDEASDAPAHNDIDLGDEINLNTSPEHDSSEALKKPQVLSDDLFFSAIAEPSAHESSNKANEDMDEIFSSNRPPVTSKEISLDDDGESGPLSTSNLNGSSTSAAAAAAAVSPAAVNLQPKPSVSDDTPKLSSFAKPVFFSILHNNCVYFSSSTHFYRH